MIAVAFVRWWYGTGWRQVAQNANKRLSRTLLSFSVPTLLRTLFAPWKRIVTPPGAGISQHFKAAGDNAVSRLVGFSVRLIVLFTAGLVMLLTGATGVVLLLAWPLIPFVAVLGICMSIVGAL